MDALDPGLNPDLADITDDDMFDTIETQYQAGEALNADYVFELIKRLSHQHNARTAELRAQVDDARAERDRLRAVIAEYQRTLNQLDADLEDDDVDGVGPQYRDWKAAQRALLDTPTTDNPEGT